MNAAEAIGETTGVINSWLLYDKYLATIQQCEVFRALNPGKFLKLVVSDTGCGMDAETIARVFEPFFTTKFTGRGLGLASVQGIIRGHNGALRVSSSPGKGSVFEVLLPVAKSVILSEDHKSDVPMDNRMKNLTFLVVDDEEDLREICAEMLETMGFHVITAANGREAIDLVKQKINRIDLALLDFTMPELNGVETFQQMHQINPDIKTILTSGFSEEEVSSRFFENGFFGFLSKPFTFQELRNAIARLNL